MVVEGPAGHIEFLARIFIFVFEHDRLRQMRDTVAAVVTKLDRVLAVVEIGFPFDRRLTTVTVRIASHLYFAELQGHHD